jgi:hypothetical protein
MREFADLLKQQGQEAIDGNIEYYADALGGVETYEGAIAALASAYNSNSLEDFTRVIDEVRFVAQGIGGAHAGH